MQLRLAIRYLVLLCVCGAIAALMFGQVRDNLRPLDDAEVSINSGGAAAPAVPELAPVPDFEPPPLGRLSDAFQRPLFRQDRRPVPEDAASSDVAPAQTLDAALVGVLFSQSERVALLAPEDGSDSVRVLEDEEYRGWRLVEIRPESAIFSRDDETVELRLVYKGQDVEIGPLEKPQ